MLTNLDGKPARDARMIHASWTEGRYAKNHCALAFAERVLAKFQATERVDKDSLVVADCNAINISISSL